MHPRHELYADLRRALSPPTRRGGYKKPVKPQAFPGLMPRKVWAFQSRYSLAFPVYLGYNGIIYYLRFPPFGAKKGKTIMGKKAYKGFNRDMTCLGFHFEEGKTYEEAEAKIYEKGLDACGYPLDCFKYYAPATSVYHEVEIDELDDSQEQVDTKVCGKKIKIGARVDIAGLVKAAVKFTSDRADWSKKENHATSDRSAASVTGYHCAASATGYQSAAWAAGSQSAAVATGNQSTALAMSWPSGAWERDCFRAASAPFNRCAAMATGDQSAASATGYQGAAVATGREGRAKAALGGWIIVAEWKKIADKWERVDVQCAKVDGKKIKADTYYMLKDGEFVEVDGE